MVQVGRHGLGAAVKHAAALVALLLASASHASDVLVPAAPLGTYDGPRALVLVLPWGQPVEMARDLQGGDCVEMPFLARFTRLCWQDYPALGLSSRAVSGAGQCVRRVAP